MPVDMPLSQVARIDRTLLDKLRSTVVVADTVHMVIPREVLAIVAQQRPDLYLSAVVLMHAFGVLDIHDIAGSLDAFTVVKAYETDFSKWAELQELQHPIDIYAKGDINVRVTMRHLTPFFIEAFSRPIK